MDSFNQEVPEIAGGCSLHLRNMLLSSLLAHSPAEVSHRPWLANLGLDFIASAAVPVTDKYDLYGWSVYLDPLVSGQHFAWATSRQHRDRSAPLKEQMVGRMYIRVLCADSIVVDLLVRDVHECTEHFLSASASEYHLLQAGMYFKGAKRKLQKFAA